MKKIQQNSLRYRILFTTVKVAFKYFFRKVEVRGLENIPLAEPVIFAPNHQSGLMDPLLVLYNQYNYPVVFMARADIFKNATMASFLRLLKIMPVFRIRDGFENLGKNEEQFNEAKDVLLDSKYLCLMPEGNHGHQHKLRPLVKGMFRIAFSAQESLPVGKEVFIVPVGIDHSYYQHAGSDVVISYGKPIRIKQYEETYTQQPALAMNALRTDLADQLSVLMHDIRSETRYDLIYKLSCLGVPAYLEVKDEQHPSAEGASRTGRQFDARRELSLKLDELDRENSTLLTDWEALCKNLDELPGYPNQTVEWMEETPSGINKLSNAVLTLFFLPGMAINTPAWLINRLICSSIEDKQMHNTFAFVVGLLTNALLYIATGIAVGVSMHHTWALTLAEIVMVGFYGAYAERWRQSIRLPLRRFRYSLNGNKRHLIQQCKTDYFFLKQSMKQWIRTT